MKLFLLVAGLFAVTLAAPSKSAETAFRRSLPALKHDEIHDDFGQYALRYVTAEGTIVNERGRLVPTPSGAYVLVVEGDTTYRGDDGKIYVTKYSAGLDGFHAKGDHLPVAPVVPE